MSRAKREKTSKLKIWVPIICIVVVGVTFYMIHDIQTKIEKMEPQNRTSDEKIVQDQATDEENTIEENSVANQMNYVVENVTSNTTKNTTSENKTNTNKNTSKTQSTTASNPGITDQKQKAIELVKKEWGEDSSVDFVFDHVENEEYVVAVKDRASATVKFYFRVNLETETVELD